MAKAKIKRLEKFDVDVHEGFQVHDAIRDGRSATVDPLRLSAVLQEMVDKINELVDRANG